jgi:hypothetical protein
VRPLRRPLRQCPGDAFDVEELLAQVQVRTIQHRHKVLLVLKFQLKAFGCRECG